MNNMKSYLCKTLFCLILVCDIIIGKTLSSDNTANECRPCKILSDSFNHWLEKTSRGKYEGGDAAWEEAKLKSYSRSEVRLVEIQEGLCSEVSKQQAKCYSLAEETENLLEQWWFHEDSQTLDLYTWLCIENLKYCCHKHHYGEFCSPCSAYENNVVCKGHGRCHGDGTRKGNGTCLCDTGYMGTQCELCANNFYSGSLGCKPCHKSCLECTGEGSSGCKKCKSGWEMTSNVCEDVDECLDRSKCKENQYCINMEGSYACKMCDTSCETCTGAGPHNCTSCKPNSMLWSGYCIENEHKQQILRNNLQKAALYLGLLIIACFIFRFSKPLASLTVLIIAMYIYYSEKSSAFNILDTVENLYFN